MRLIHMAALAAVTLSLASCGAIQKLGGLSVSPKTVLASEATFKTLQDTATIYIKGCTPTPQPAGCSADAIDQVDNAIKSGRDARNTLDTFMAANPGKPVASSTYEKLTSAISTIQSITNRYSGTAQ